MNCFGLVYLGMDGWFSSLREGCAATRKRRSNNFDVDDELLDQCGDDPRKAIPHRATSNTGN